MADRTINIGVQLRGSSTLDIPVAANTWNSVQMRLTGTDWLNTPGLFFGYTARVSTDGGATFTPWGGTTASSPTFAKDGVTKVGLGGLWEWNAAFNAGATFTVVVDCPTPFNWGMTISLQDADVAHAVII